MRVDSRCAPPITGRVLKLISPQRTPKAIDGIRSVVSMSSCGRRRAAHGAGEGRGNEEEGRVYILVKSRIVEKGKRSLRSGHQVATVDSHVNYCCVPQRLLWSELNDFPVHLSSDTISSARRCNVSFSDSECHPVSPLLSPVGPASPPMIAANATRAGVALLVESVSGARVLPNTGRCT